MDYRRPSKRLMEVKKRKKGTEDQKKIKDSERKEGRGIWRVKLDWQMNKSGWMKSKLCCHCQENKQNVLCTQCMWSYMHSLLLYTNSSLKRKQYCQSSFLLTQGSGTYSWTELAVLMQWPSNNSVGLLSNIHPFIALLISNTRLY